MASDEKVTDTQPPAPELPQEIPEEFDVAIINMDKVLFEGKASSIIAPSAQGNYAILPGHTPLFTKLDKGKLVVNNDKDSTDIEIEGGIAKITQTKIVILVGF